MNEFDVLIANDGLSEFEITLDSNKHLCKSLNVNGTISSNRRNIISHAIEMGYKNTSDNSESNSLEVNGKTYEILKGEQVLD